VDERAGRAHPRVTVPRWPPGKSRRDLSGMNPIERIVDASRRPFVEVLARPSRSSAAVVLISSEVQRKGSSLLRHGSPEHWA
jgi:hypothetical protein